MRVVQNEQIIIGEVDIAKWSIFGRRQQVLAKFGTCRRHRLQFVQYKSLIPWAKTDSI